MKFEKKKKKKWKNKIFTTHVYQVNMPEVTLLFLAAMTQVYHLIVNEIRIMKLIQ